MADLSGNKETLQSQRTFLFSDLPTNRENLQVVVVETIDPHYSQYVWPCSVVLAQYIWYHRRTLLDKKHVLEIGAGTALPSIMAATCAKPASVTITDNAQFFPRCFTNCRRSLSLNNLENVHNHSAGDPVLMKSEAVSNCPIHLLGLTWGTVSPHLLQYFNKDKRKKIPIPDIVLGSDCFYDEALFEDVLSTVYFLLKTNVEMNNNCSVPAFFCTYQMRSADWSISDLLNKWGLQYEDIPLVSFHGDSCDIANSRMPGNHRIDMMKITLK